MINKIIATFLTIVTLCPALLKAGEGFYVGGLAGVNFAQTHGEAKNMKMKTGFTGRAVTGYAFSNGLRLEGEFGYIRNRIKDVKFEGEKHQMHGNFYNYTFMANCLYYLPLQTVVKPFVGIGAGYQIAKGHITKPVHVKAKQSGFSHQFIAGTACDVSHNVEASLEYRLLNGRKNVRDHSLALGLKRFF